MKTSVALCTYNGENFLEEQLQSIISQSVSPQEIVICDDGATDNTVAILRKFETKFPGIFRIYINEENLGYVRNFEKAMQLCTGEIIFLADQDDVWQNNKIEETINYFNNNPEKLVAAHNLGLLDEENKNQTFWKLKNFQENQENLSNNELLEHILINGNVFPGMSLALKKEAIDKYLPLKKIDKIIIHDYELVIKALNDNTFGILNKVLGFYRKHDSQSIGYHKKEKEKITEIAEIYLLSQQFERLKTYTKEFGLSPKIAANFQKKLQKKYSVFLRKYPFPKRIFIDLKNKYYYKIIKF